MRWVVVLVGVGGITAMLGVMLNLILGLSRVVLAMARRSDLPTSLAAIDRRGVPLRATLAVATVIGALVLIGDVKLAWSFSATTVLIYYALTNLCAIRVDSTERIFPVGLPGLVCWMLRVSFVYPLANARGGSELNCIGDVASVVERIRCR